MSSIGDCSDNSMVESFSGSIQLELFDGQALGDSPRIVQHQRDAYSRVAGASRPRRARAILMAAVKAVMS